MSNLSDIIEDFIKKIFEANNQSTIEIQRNLLAQQFECSPSQINYVLSTRFNNDKGYTIESKRGGGGYIRIFKINISENEQLESILNTSIGDSITINKATDIIDVFAENGIISLREQNIIKGALSDRAFSQVHQKDRNKLRACILKEVLISLLLEKNK